MLLLTAALRAQTLDGVIDIHAHCDPDSTARSIDAVDLAKLALQFSCANPDIATTVAGSANPENIRKWAKWLAEPIDETLLREVLEIFRPVKNIGHKEGLAENN